VVASFSGQGCSAGPSGPVVQGRDGKLYGTTLGISGSAGCFFRLFSSGLSFPFAFQSSNGDEPAGGVLLATDGNFYGVTQYGGSSNNGVFYKVTATGSYTAVHEFGGGADGANPIAPPIEASDGNIYGVTLGSFTLPATLYRYSPQTGTFVNVYTFDATHGQYPSSLIQGTDGNLYGTSTWGGSSSCGTLFKISTSGTPLWSYSFPCGSGGYNPVMLVQASDGNFYGPTVNGGVGIGFGTIFKLDPEGNVSTLYSFSPSSSKAGEPLSLIQANDGNLYGTAALGGKTTNDGSLFEITPSGVFTRLYSFSGTAGTTPNTALVQDTTGILYGTSIGGGKSNAGTVYKLNNGLAPFVTFVLPVGKVGQNVEILGQGLTGTTGVTFNGISATSFRVLSDSYMTAVVPNGATTGPVAVSTPSGSLTSNVNLRID